MRRGWPAGAVRVTRAAAAIVLEQLVMQPVNYGLYIIPLSTALNGGGLATMASEVCKTGSRGVRPAHYRTPLF
jgi:hypothetical protein